MKREKERTFPLISNLGNILLAQAPESLESYERETPPTKPFLWVLPPQRWRALAPTVATAFGVVGLWLVYCDARWLVYCAAGELG